MSTKRCVCIYGLIPPPPLSSLSRWWWWLRSLCVGGINFFFWWKKKFQFEISMYTVDDLIKSTGFSKSLSPWTDLKIQNFKKKNKFESTKPPFPLIRYNHQNGRWLSIAWIEWMNRSIIYPYFHHQSIHLLLSNLNFLK